MIATNEKEQADEDQKMEFCTSEIAATKASVKAHTGSVKDLDADIASKEDEIATAQSEIAALQKGIEDLDKSVVEATEQRKAEHAEYTSTAAANQAAVELIGMAKNRMNKFYAPDQYKAPPTTTESTSPYGLVQVESRASRADPGPAPETFGEYKKSESSGGVMAMMDQMIKDVEMDIQAAKMDEEHSQEDYEEAMKDASVKRAEDSKLVITKDGEKAEMASKLEGLKEGKQTKTGQLGNANDTLNDLHKTCDFLLDNYDSRKESRTKESDGLKQSKAVLAGAKLGFLQRA